MKNLPSEETMRRVQNNLRAFTLGSFVVKTDEEIEWFGNIFVSHQLLARGILFETFLQDPKAIFEAATGRSWPPAVDYFLPLLPAQRAAAQRVQFEMRARQCGKSVRSISRPFDDRDLAFLKRQAD